MYFSALLLTLAATASAVDVRAYSNTGCNGGWVGCAGINPGVCCVFSNSASSGRLSVSVNAVSKTSFLLLTDLLELTGFDRSQAAGASAARPTQAAAAHTSQTSKTQMVTQTFA
jgi:hypothetical protein